jgi:membrane protein insertase Oxa1/YidC/SpoIIIJ
MKKGEKVSAKMKVVNEEVRKLKDTLRGEKLFLATEKIYKNHNYHPIHSIVMGAEILVMLPVLISAILLFTKSGFLTDQSFLIINDLSQPDQLVSSLNILPIIMFTITLVDAITRYRYDKVRQYRFLFISFVMLILVYNLPSGLILYWIGNNLASFALTRKKLIGALVGKSEDRLDNR